MNSAKKIEEVSLGDYLRDPENCYSFKAMRSRILIAIRLAEVEGYSSTQKALIDLLREIDASRNQALLSLTESRTGYA